MKIYNINPINFVERKNPIFTASNKDGKFTKESFYQQIEGFLNKKYSKEKYLKMFSDGISEISKQNSIQEYSSIERKYINNLVSIIDMSDNLKKIPDNYLKTNMEILLRSKK